MAYIFDNKPFNPPLPTIHLESTTTIIKRKKITTFDPSTKAIKVTYEDDGESIEEGEDSIDMDKISNVYKSLSLKYCIGLYYWFKTGTPTTTLQENLSEDDYMDFHYFGLQWDNKKQALFWKTVGKMIGGKK